MNLNHHPIEYINEELKARGWDGPKLYEMMGKNINLNMAEIDFLSLKNPAIYLGEGTAKKLSKAFGTSYELWLNLDKAWRELSSIK
jgi:plasmid maintenance system antidote protein VapI